MNDKFVSLSKRFVLRNSEDEIALLNLENGDIFSLNDEQIEFILLLDGTKRFDEVVKFHDPKLFEWASVFLNNLIEIGGIEYNDNLEKIFLETRIVKSPRLESVHFEMTGKCNMRCVDCYQGDLVINGVSLKFDKIISLLNEMQEMQVGDISISGGEPLILEFLPQLLNEIENRKIRISGIFTNGTLIDENFISSIKGLISKFPIYVSLDSIGDNSLSFRGIKNNISADVSKRIVSNISLLVANGVDVIINTMINRENIGTLFEMYDTIKKLKIKTWRLGFPKLTPLFKKNLNFSVQWEDASEICFSLIKKHLSEMKSFDFQIEYLYREIFFRQGLPNLSGSDYVCDYEGRREQCCIKPNGDVVSCSFLNSMPIGNVKKQNLRDIWHSQKMRKIKDTKINMIKECENCSFVSLCGAGCRANTLFLNGNFFQGKDDFACQAVKFFKERIYPFVTSAL